LAFNNNKLEEIFKVKNTVSTTTPNKSSNNLVKKTTVNLLDDKRSNHIVITLTKFKFYGNFAKIRDGINKMDGILLTEENLASLLSIVPTDEEISTISLYDGKQKETNKKNKTIKQNK
jgi:hypothetical protein